MTELRDDQLPPDVHRTRLTLKVTVTDPITGKTAESFRTLPRNLLDSAGDQAQNQADHTVAGAMVESYGKWRGQTDVPWERGQRQ